MTVLQESSLVEDWAKRWAERKAYLTASAYCPIEPTPKQWLFILDTRKEIFFGGQAGGGKTISQLASALLYVDKPSYRALILRRTYADLALPGAPMDLADQWLHGTDAKRKDAGREWWFPSGAKIVFGYMATDGDRYRYQSSRWDLVAYDEAGQFTEAQLRYLFSRLRQDKANVDIPLRYRVTGNPGGPSHSFLRDRYVFPTEKTERLFIPCGMDDNPYLDTETYRSMLSELDPYTRAQLEHGDWDAEPSGGYFEISNMASVPEHKSNGKWRGAVTCRAWDLASTEVGDWAVGAKVAYDKRTRLWRVLDVVRVRAEPMQLERVMRATVEKDGRGCPQIIEQEIGSAGKFAMRDIRQRWLAGYPVYPVPPSGSKLTRARLPASLIAAGDVEMTPGRWNDDFLAELISFPNGANDDQVDAIGHAFAWISKQMQGNLGPRGVNVTQAEVTARPKRLKISRLTIR